MELEILTSKNRTKKTDVAVLVSATSYAVINKWLLYKVEDEYKITAKFASFAVDKDSNIYLVLSTSPGNMVPIKFGNQCAFRARGIRQRVECERGLPLKFGYDSITGLGEGVAVKLKKIEE